MDMPLRKTTHLTQYDYATPGAYFVTICTKDRKELLCHIVGEGLCALPQIHLTPIGKEIEQSLLFLHQHTEGFAIDKYVIMPNHIHLLVQITALPQTGGHGGPPLHKIIGQFKSYTTHRYGSCLWQRSYNDHVVRGDLDYQDIWQYIDQNPSRWKEDDLYAVADPD